MPSASDVKNLARTAKQVGEAAKDIGKAISLGKSLFRGKDSKISTTSGILMLSSAVILDITQILISLIPAIGTALAGPLILAIQFSVFTLWFRFHGVSYWGSEQALSKTITGILELIPIVSAFIPSTTINVGAAIAFIRLQEAGVQNAGQAKEKTEAGKEIKSEKRGGAERGDNVLNAKRTPEERAAVSQAGRKQEENVPNTAQAPGAEQNPYLTAGLSDVDNPQVPRPGERFIDISPGAQERRNLEASGKRNRPIDIDAINLEATRRKNREAKLPPDLRSEQEQPTDPKDSLNPLAILNRKNQEILDKKEG